ncbi:hypothetical protein B0H14DRAFT_3685124 [Mycena olivaceomarginata]|nr:hypothetical protein B0H14DRAFT_3685124 [Mycena olivaceomarginata]
MPDFRDGIAAWNAAWELSFPFFDSKVRNLETLVESNASGEQEKMQWNYNLVRSVRVIQAELRVLAATSVLEPNSCWKTLTPTVREAHMLEGLFRTCLREPVHMPNTRMYTSDITLVSMETDNGEGFLTPLRKYVPNEASVVEGGSTSYLHPGWTKETIERLENAGHVAGVQIWIALRDSFLDEFSDRCPSFTTPFHPSSEFLGRLKVTGMNRPHCIGAPAYARAAETEKEMFSTAPEPKTDESATSAADIPAAPVPAPAPAPRRSARTHAPSKAAQDSLESQNIEVAAKAAGEDWATKRKTPNLRARAAAAFAISTPTVPKNFREAMEHPEVWRAPMEKEYGSLVGHEVWVLVDPPPHFLMWPTRQSQIILH